MTVQNAIVTETEAVHRLVYYDAIATQCFSDQQF